MWKWNFKGKILDIFHFGILSFHHGDNRVIRGGPSGFWEVLNNHPSSVSLYN